MKNMKNILNQQWFEFGRFKEMTYAHLIKNIVYNIFVRIPTNLWSKKRILTIF